MDSLLIVSLVLLVVAGVIAVGSILNDTYHL